MAEVHYGAAKDHPGLVLLTTLGTGIGTAIVYRGVLVPNSELGHIEVDGHDAETRAASSAQGAARACRTASGCPGCSATTRCSRRCSGRT